MIKKIMKWKFYCQGIYGQLHTARDIKSDTRKTALVGAVIDVFKINLKF
jgi:hypothetical protein